MSPELENLLGQVEFDIQRNRNISKPISSGKDMRKYLDSL